MRLSKAPAMAIAVGALLATVVAAPVTTAAPAESAPAAHGQSGAKSSVQGESKRLSKGLARALRNAGFDHLVDYDNRVYGEAQPAAFLPNIDVAVIELNRRGRVAGVANVLYDRDNPRGYQVEVGARTMQTTGVEFSQ